MPLSFAHESSRLVLTVLAYLLVVLGLIWVMVPYKLRDQIGWFSKTTARWRGLHAFAFALWRDFNRSSISLLLNEFSSFAAGRLAISF